MHDNFLKCIPDTMYGNFNKNDKIYENRYAYIDIILVIYYFIYFPHFYHWTFETFEIFEIFILENKYLYPQALWQWEYSHMT